MAFGVRPAGALALPPKRSREENIGLQLRLGNDEFTESGAEFTEFNSCPFDIF